MPSVELVIDGKTFPLFCDEGRTFKSGKKGFWANGKVKVNDETHNVSFGIVNIEKA